VFNLARTDQFPVFIDKEISNVFEVPLHIVFSHRGTVAKVRRPVAFYKEHVEFLIDHHILAERLKTVVPVVHLVFCTLQGDNYNLLDLVHNVFLEADFVLAMLTVQVA